MGKRFETPPKRHRMLNNYDPNLERFQRKEEDRLKEIKRRKAAKSSKGRIERKTRNGKGWQREWPR